MGLQDKWLVSVDDHIIEPPHLWEKWLPQKYKALGPQYVRDEDGEGWVYNGQRSPYQQLTAAAGDFDELSPFPITMEEMRPGCYEPAARVADMNRNRVLSSAVFPTYSGLAGNTFWEGGDLEVGKACISAYNDFLLQEWSASQPGRFVPIILVPLWDMDAAVKEVERCIPLGAKAIAFSQAPHKLIRMENGEAKALPSIHDRSRYWDPLLSIANESGLPFCIHISSVTSPMTTSRDAPVHVAACVARVVDPELCVFDWLFSGHLLRFPNLKILLSEGGVSWIPAALEAADYQVWRHDGHLNKFTYESTEQGGFSVPKNIERLTANKSVWSPDFMPSDLFRRQMFGCYFHNEPALKNLADIGVDNVMIEVDFPHSDSTWPNSMLLAEQTVGHQPEEIQDKIMFGNAARVFNLTLPKPPVLQS